MKCIITCSDSTWNKPNSIENGRAVRRDQQTATICADEISQAISLMKTSSPAQEGFQLIQYAG